MRDDNPNPWFPLTTERLILRELREADFDDVQAYGSHDEVVRFMDWGPNTPEQTRVVLDRWLAEQQAWPRAAVTLAIEIAATGRVVGTIRLGLDERRPGVADVGYCLHREVWRQGYGTEVARAVIAAAFGPLGLHRVEANCDTRNAGSFGIMEKLGMTREGVLRQAHKRRDGWRDSYLYALLSSEWAH
jgi:RimJ/RimL family protein N-acetyltransferase